MRAMPCWIAAAVLSVAALACESRSDENIHHDNDDGGAPSPDCVAVDEDDAASDEDAGSDEDGGSESECSPRAILAGELVNARDLGGVPLPGGARVAYGAIFRGPPLVLSPRGCEGLNDVGVRTDIDLRVDGERAAKPDSACATEQAQLLVAPLPVPYTVSPADYIAMLDARDSMAAIFAALGDAGAYPVYFHCTWGRDRTGVVAALILLELGASRADIMDEYLLSGATVGAYPMSLMAMLDEIERRGGVTAYLMSLGITAQQLATLHGRATARE